MLIMANWYLRNYYPYLLFNIKMAGTVLIQRLPPTINNWFCWISFGNEGSSWISLPRSASLTPGLYTLDPDQKDNLDWYNENLFKIDAFGRLHILRMMQENLPDYISIIQIPS